LYPILKFENTIVPNLMSTNANFNSELPIHFFTIVLNGQPYIPYHIEIFKQLPFRWHWHIVEGVADLKHDPGGSATMGGTVSDEIHRHGLSHDGTTEYIDELGRLYPDRITIYRKPEGVFWNGKLEMLNAPLPNIQAECLLWQVDADELWTLKQLETGRQLFISCPSKTAAFYWCWYFVGENLLIGTRNYNTKNFQQECLRTWRFKPGSFWTAQTKPILVQYSPDRECSSLADIDPFRSQETEKLGLVFQHFAWVTRSQVVFKERYYGHENTVSQWEKLQVTTKFPVFLRDYFNWVRDGTQVDLASSRRIVPIAQRAKNTHQWRFLQPGSTPKILIDGVFFQIASSGIARVWRSLLEEWVKSGFAKYLILLDRDGTAPQISGINYELIHRYELENAIEDSFLLQEICDRHQVDLFMSTYYTQPISTPGILLVHDMIPEAIGAVRSVTTWQEKNYAICYAAQYIAISENTARDLCRFYPQIDPETITVALNGVDPLFAPSLQAEIDQFRFTHQITRPYFMIVGDRVGLDGYKNAIHTFRAISQLPNPKQFEIVCVGGNTQLEPESAALVAGIDVHRLSLSDQELKVAYAGAIALVYPSYYEGFGLPVLEAMACGCPVITCRNSSLPEVAGAAAIYVSETDVAELVAALQQVQQPEVRSPLITAGLARSKHFSWPKMAAIIAQVAIDTHSDIQSGQLRPLIKLSWAQFRQAQSQSELTATQNKLVAAQRQIASMESTKFWQLRQQWFQLKKWLKLMDDNK
jgi:glycosyltransferase involved in cell wall biosynthesis